MIATKREHFTPTNSSRICGKHFKETDYIEHFGSKSLKKDAVPSIFDFPKHLQKKIVSRKRRRSISLKTENQNGFVFFIHCKHVNEKFYQANTLLYFNH